MGPAIRAAVPDDARRLSALAFRAKGHWGYPAEWMELWRQDLTFTDEYFSAHRTFVAVEAGAAVGMCVLEFGETLATIEHVWVSPDRHGHGIGRALMARALAVAAEAGVSKVQLLSDPFAEAFYLKLGARRIGDVPAPMPGAEDRTLPLMEFATNR